jgi:hypothetical protein
MWGGFGIGLLMASHGLALGLIGLAAVGLIALWVLHVVVYAARIVAEARSGDEQPQAPAMTSAALSRMERGIDHVGRRRALGALVRAAGAGVVVSVPVLLWPSDSSAFCGQCTRNRDCGVGWVCRNTAPVNSGKVCNECVKA